MNKEQEKVWDTIAKDWNDYRNTPRTEIKEFLKNKQGKHLDLGCGSGRNFMNKKGLKITGIDFSKNMIEQAKEKAKNLRIRAEIKKANAWETNLPDEEYDCGILYAVLHCIQGKEKQQKTIKEFYRLLKKGAEGYISVWGKNSPRIKAAIKEQQKKGETTKETTISWTTKKGTKVERYTKIFEAKELRKMIISTGFTITKEWEDENMNYYVKKE
jgi:ubiquinone/menaquinone biosynthesis C-methylase UbiE